MKSYGWVGIGLFVVAILVIIAPSLLSEPHQSGRAVLHPHREANVSVDDTIETGPSADTCIISANNDSSEAVTGFHLTKLNFGQPDKPGGSTPAIPIPKQSFDIRPGQSVNIKISVPKLKLDSKHRGWIEYEYSYTDSSGRTETAGLGHIPGWKLTQ